MMQLIPLAIGALAVLATAGGVWLIARRASKDNPTW